MPPGTWSHLATTYDGSTLRLYVNGAQVSSKPVTGAIVNGSGPLHVGGNAVWAEWFSGQIDDLRVYNRALTAGELQTDMNTPVGGTPPPPADTQAPTAPAGLAASGQTQTQITLNWNASSDNVGVTGYSRYRNGTLISSGTGTSFSFTGLTCGTSYTLAVDAYDAAGNRSTRPSISASTSACSPAPDTQAPTAPAGLAASGQTQTQITLNWNASSDNVGVTGYSRYQNGTLVSGGTGTSFNFTGLTCGTSYTLAVDAYDAAGNRSTRPSISASTLACSAGTGPVAAYSFDTATGTSLTDNSGGGNTGSISGATWTSAGKSGGALAFDGVNDMVTVADQASLDLSTGMTLEAWIRPTANSTWRTSSPRSTSGNLTYGLFSNSDAPQPSAIVSIGSNPVQDITRGPTEVSMSELDAPRVHLRRRRAAPVRQRHPGLDHERDGCDGQLGRPAPDRWQQRLGGVVPGPDRRSPRLQPCPHAEPAPDRHEHAGRTAAGRRHTGTVGSRPAWSSAARRRPR